MLKALFFLEIFKNFSWHFRYAENWLDKKFNNCNTHIAQYLKKQRQLDNEIWSVSGIQHEKYFSLKLTHRMQWRR